jgi:NADPH-dependent ferric siderophore reductase
MSAASPAVAAPELAARAPRRVRHETRRRQLEVQKVDKIAASMIRVTLSGDLAGFTSLGIDDHITLFFPDGATPAGSEPPMLARDYTPRHYDAARNVLEIDFAIHDAGPATRWAEQARPGDMLSIGGPRGSFIIPLEFDWYLFIGDDTAIPAISRRLNELPAGARAVVLVEVDGPADEVALPSQAEVSVTWAHRNGAPAGESDVLAKTLKTMRLPAGDYYAWVACESLIAKALRVQLLAEHGANKKWMRAAGYWRRGAAAVHDTHDD